MNKLKDELTIRSAVDPKRSVLTFHNNETINISTFHEAAQVKSISISLRPHEVDEIISTWQRYIASMQSRKIGAFDAIPIYYDKSTIGYAEMQRSGCYAFRGCVVLDADALRFAARTVDSMNQTGLYD